ncbi:CGP-CTERM sorting domain-containing protein [Thermococcus henrietii]|uniref:CGP-CTERM sorting domain-containing protein n=1 Tax=Thermococcus henrietii TaxID=2016361 RepID=UPI000C0847D7|nr:CGP-CTERM sorting domain-containing protein [Thermococcus henrietii]
MSRVVAVLLTFLLLAPIFLHEVNAANIQSFQAYQITIKGLTYPDVGVFLIPSITPYWRVNGSFPGEYRLLYFAYPSYHNITNWTIKYMNLTNLPGITHKLKNTTLPWPTNRFDVFTYRMDSILHWWARNGTTYDYLFEMGGTITSNETVLPIIAKYGPVNHQLVGRVEGEYIIFNGSQGFKIPVSGLLRYYPKQLLNDLVGVLYQDVITTSSDMTIHREALLIYPRHLSYWKTNGKIYVGVNFSTGVELNANQSIPILLYSKGKLKPIVDVLRLITPQGDPLRNLKNPIITLTSQTWITPATESKLVDILYDNISEFYELQYSLVSNGTSAILIVTSGDAFVPPLGEEPPSVIPSYYPYLVVNGVPRFLNLSPTVRQFNLSDWSLYQFKFSVWRSHYELLWEESPPMLNSSIAYVLNGTCWRLINNFHNSPGFVANGTVEGNYMVFRFNRTTLRIPLRELAKYYPPKVWEWQLAAAKDGNGYLIIPTAGFDYGVVPLIFGPGNFLLPVDTSSEVYTSGVYALYYVDGSLKPVFDLLRLMSPQGDLVRNLPNPFNSSVSFGLCSAERRGNANSSTIRVSRNTTTTIRENTTLPSTNTTGGANETPVHSNKTRTNTTTTPTSTTTKEKNICGPGLVVITAILPLLLRRPQN